MLGGQPKSLTVVSQNTDRFRTPAAEDKQASGERIGVESLAAELRQRVDAFSAIDGFDCHQDAELWRDLDQTIISHNPRLKVASSVVVPFHSIRIVPRRPSNSMTHVGAPAVCGAISSTNAG